MIEKAKEGKLLQIAISAAISGGEEIMKIYDQPEGTMGNEH